MILRTLASLAFCLFYLTNSQTGSAQSWRRPEPGWLYVVDVDNRTNPAISRIIVFNPETKSIIEKLPIEGYQVSSARSNDGNFLYIVAGFSGSGVLYAFDTNAGRVTSRVQVGDRILFTGTPDIPTIAVSNDNNSIYVENRVTLPDGSDQYSISVFTMSRRQLEARNEPYLIPNCGLAGLVPWGRDGVAVHCPNSNALIKVSLPAPIFRNSRDDVSGLSIVHLIREGESVSNVEGHKAAVACIADDGNVVEVFPSGRTVLVKQKSSADREDSKTRVAPPYSSDVLRGRFIPFQKCLRSATRLYVGSTSWSLASQYDGNLNEIDVFDAESGKYIASVPTPIAFSTLALNSDGSLLYAASVSLKNLLEIPTAANVIGGILSNVGFGPSVVLPVR